MVGIRLTLYFLMSYRINNNMNTRLHGYRISRGWWGGGGRQPVIWHFFFVENCMDLPLGTNKSFTCTGGALSLRSSRVWCPGMMALHWWYAVFEVDRAVVSRYNRPVPLLVSDPLVYELWESLCDQLLF